MKSNCPIGSDTLDAPWNEEELPDKEVDVVVSLTISKIVTVKVNDYKVTYDNCEDKQFPMESIDYGDCNLKDAVESQIWMPYEAGYLLSKVQDSIDLGKNSSISSNMIDDLKDWSIDDFVVELDE